MRLKCGGIFIYSFIIHLLLSPTVKEFRKIGEPLVKLWTRAGCPVFLAHGVEGIGVTVNEHLWCRLAQLTWIEGR